MPLAVLAQVQQEARAALALHPVSRDRLSLVAGAVAVREVQLPALVDQAAAAQAQVQQRERLAMLTLGVAAAVDLALTRAVLVVQE